MRHLFSQVNAAFSVWVQRAHSSQQYIIAIAPSCKYTATFPLTSTISLTVAVTHLKNQSWTALNHTRRNIPKSHTMAYLCLPALVYKCRIARIMAKILKGSRIINRSLSASVNPWSLPGSADKPFVLRGSPSKGPKLCTKPRWTMDAGVWLIQLVVWWKSA